MGLPRAKAKEYMFWAAMTLIMKKRNPLEETFGMAKFLRPTRQILRDTDKELWNKA